MGTYLSVRLGVHLHWCAPLICFRPNVPQIVPPKAKKRPQIALRAICGDSHGSRFNRKRNPLKQCRIRLKSMIHSEFSGPLILHNSTRLYKKSGKFVPPEGTIYYICKRIQTYDMTFAFYLKDKNKKEGTPLVLIVSHHNKKFKKSTGIVVKPEHFKKQRVKNESVNEKLRAIEIILNERLNQFSTDEEVVNALEYAVYEATGKGEPVNEKESTPSPSFFSYFEEWADRDTPQKRQRGNTLKLIRECMGEGYNWNDVDTAFYFRLVQRLKEKNYSVNYIGSVIKKLKTVMSEGYKLKYHTNVDYHQFSSPTEQADAVYLTKTEVDRLWKIELPDETERKARDLFLLGCYTAMRFSDYSRLTKDNIRDGMIYMTQQKTAGRVVIPASPKVIAILARNGGAAPKMGQEVLNKTIKTVCFKARIFEKVEITKSKGDRHETKMVEKYTCVSSHTARRTAATLLYQSGVPASSVMQITGHRTEAEFYKYIRTTKEENAKALKDNPFFK